MADSEVLHSIKQSIIRILTMSFLDNNYYVKISHKHMSLFSFTGFYLFLFIFSLIFVPEMTHKRHFWQNKFFSSF